MDITPYNDFCKKREAYGWIIFELPEKVLKCSDETPFYKQILELVKTTRKLALDMQKVVFVDSSIITLVLSVEKMLTEKGGALVVLYPNKQAAELFSVTSIDKITKILANENDLQHL